MSYPNENKPSSPRVRRLTNNSENLFTVLTNIWIRKYLLITKSIVTCYKHILMTFCYVFRAEEVAPHDFLFRQKSASRLRSRHTPSFFAENPRVGTFPTEVAPHDFLFRSPPAWLGDSGIASKGIPCAFSSPQGTPTRAKSSPLPPRNASIAGPRPAQLRHLSPLPYCD